MLHASREPISDIATPFTTFIQDFMNNQVLTLVAFNLPAYAFYRLVAAVLIFSPYGALRLPRIWHDLVCCVMLQMFLTLAFLSQQSLKQRDANQVNRLESYLVPLKPEILRFFVPFQSPEAFGSTLLLFLKATSINNAHCKSASKILCIINTSIDPAIEAQDNRLRPAQRQRPPDARSTVRTVAADSLIAAISLLGRANILVPWLKPYGKSLSPTLSSFSRAFQMFMGSFSKRNFHYLALR